MSTNQKQEVKDLLIPPPPKHKKKGVLPPPPLKKTDSILHDKEMETIKINLKLQETEKKMTVHKEKMTLALQKVKEAGLKEKDILSKIE